jgi:cytochrome c556
MRRALFRSAWAARGVLVAAGLLAFPVAASFQQAPERTIKARQSAYFLMGQQMARFNATLKGDLAFDKPSLQLSADTLELLSRVVVDQFPAGSDQAPTRAKPDVWKDPAKFRQLGEATHAEAMKLKQAVASGDMAALKLAYSGTTRSCKMCHDQFKAD